MSRASGLFESRGFSQKRNRNLVGSPKRRLLLLLEEKHLPTKTSRPLGSLKTRGKEAKLHQKVEKLIFFMSYFSFPSVSWVLTTRRDSHSSGAKWHTVDLVSRGTYIGKTLLMKMLQVKWKEKEVSGKVRLQGQELWRPSWNKVEEGSISVAIVKWSRTWLHRWLLPRDISQWHSESIMILPNWKI